MMDTPDAKATAATPQEMREQRILDATLTLILRWGYNKTTIADIAREASVAKGTIYLHWRTRDDLFDALVQRERALVARDVRQRLRQDSEGWTLRAIVRATALATLQRPLIRALLVSDRDVLGKLADREITTIAYIERVAGFEAYIALLRGHGLVRTDLTVKEEVAIWSAALAGFLFAAPMMPPTHQFSDERTADLIAEMVNRTLETGRSPSPSETRDIGQSLTHYLARSKTSAEARLENGGETP